MVLYTEAELIAKIKEAYSQIAETKQYSINTPAGAQMKIARSVEEIKSYIEMLEDQLQEINPVKYADKNGIVAGVVCR